MKKIVVLISGSGSNLQAIIDKCNTNYINADLNYSILYDISNKKISNFINISNETTDSIKKAYELALKKATNDDRIIVELKTSIPLTNKVPAGALIVLSFAAKLPS